MDAQQRQPLLAPHPDEHQHDDQHDDQHHGDPKLFRIVAIMLSFAGMGLVVSTVGLMIPRLEAYYGLNDAQVSLIFVVSPAGYILATASTRTIHHNFGRRGIALLGPVLQLVATLGAGAHPQSYALFVSALAIGYLGIGLMDGAWCTWAASMPNANTVSGFLHGSYSIGAGLGPFLGELLMTAGHARWYQWYLVLAIISAVECIVLALAFRKDSSHKYKQEQRDHQVANPLARDDQGLLDNEAGTPGDGVGTTPHDNNDDDHKHLSSLTTPTGFVKSIMMHPVIWIFAAFMLFEVGTELAISGWVVLFLRRARHADPQLAASGSSCFWISHAVGRLGLGAVTDHFGQRRAVTAYLLSVVSLGVSFAVLVGNNPWASVVLVALMGFFCGPLIPSALVQLVRALPKDLHVAAITYVSMIGQVGGALLPAGIGLLIQALGIAVFPLVIMVQSILALGFWLCFTKATAASAS